MKTEVFFQNEQQAVRAVKALGEFADLQTEQVQQFSQYHKSFAPEDWWTSRSWSGGRLSFRWEQMQGHVREVWKKHFPYDRCIGIVQVGTYLSSMQDESAYRDLGSETDPYGGSGYDVGFGFSKWPRVWDYQLAVMFLNVQSWRAKICELCGRFYIAESPNGRFCNFAKDNENSCFWKHRKQSKEESREKNRTRTNERRRAGHAAHKNKINTKRRAHYAALKGKAKRKRV